MFFPLPAMNQAFAHAICDAQDPVQALCSDAGLWGDIAGDLRLVDGVRSASARVRAFIEEKS